MKPTIAAFDFDGTITTRDSFVPFLIYTAGIWPFAQNMLPLIPKMSPYLWNRLNRQEVKEIILTKFFKGMPISQLRKYGEIFAHSRQMEYLIRPEAKQRIEWHQKQQHRCILISASIEIYLEPWGRMMGFDDVLGSRLEITTSGAATGKLKGLNCRGEEKVRRLEELVGSTKEFTIYAYGDSPGDQALLSIADYPFFKRMS